MTSPLNQLALLLALVAPMVSGCCSSPVRSVESPSATLTMVDGRAALGLVFLDYEVVRSDPHCGGSSDLRSAGVALVSLDGAELLGYSPLDPRGLEPTWSNGNAPTVLEVAQGVDGSLLAALAEPSYGSSGRPTQASLWPPIDAGPARIWQAEPVGDMLVVAWESDEGSGVSAWSPTEGQIWTHELENRAGCGQQIFLGTSPDRSLITISESFTCPSGKGASTWVLGADGGERVPPLIQDEALYCNSAVADDGTTVTYSLAENVWIERDIGGAETGRFDQPGSLAPSAAYGWGERWLVRDATGNATLLERDGTVVGKVDLADQPILIAEETLWVLAGSTLAQRCVHRYDASLTPGEATCVPLEALDVPDDG